MTWPFHIHIFVTKADQGPSQLWHIWKRHKGHQRMPLGPWGMSISFSEVTPVFGPQSHRPHIIMPYGNRSPTRVPCSGFIFRSPALFCWKTSEVMKMSTWTTWIWAPQLQTFGPKNCGSGWFWKSEMAILLAISPSSWVSSGKDMFSSANIL